MFGTNVTYLISVIAHMSFILLSHYKFCTSQYILYICIIRFSFIFLFYFLHFSDESYYTVITLMNMVLLSTSTLCVYFIRDCFSYIFARYVIQFILHTVSRKSVCLQNSTCAFIVIDINLICSRFVRLPDQK